MGKPKADKLETIVERILAGGGYITPAEREFICAMRKARENDVVYVADESRRANGDQAKVD